MKRSEKHRQPIAPVDAPLDTGLTDAQVRQRQAAGWGNLPVRSAGKTDIQIIAGHCITFFNLIFVVLAVLLALAGSSVKNMAFLVVVVINTVIGIFQEIRAKRAVEKLTLVAEGTVQVLREGSFLQLPSRELVRDDLLRLGVGDSICADGILRSGQLLVNESLVTGEDRPVEKKPGDALLSGSFPVAGTGLMQLTAVGADAFANRLALEAKKNPQAEKSGMMKDLDKLIRVMGLLLIPVGIALFCQQFYALQLGLQNSAEATAAALVGMIPEGLYLLTSVAMAASALKLSRQRVLVQDMNCIETLARVDVLCVDKTGTITEPAMEVADLIPLQTVAPGFLEAVLSAFYAGTEPENDTARAMQVRFAGKSAPILRQLPFTSETKWACRELEGYGSILVGAPTAILGARAGQAADTVACYTGRGYRVLLLAGCDGFPDGSIDPEKVTPLALVTLSSRIRPDAPATFAYFKEQGVAIKVISGDDPATVSEIACRAGIEGARRYVDCAGLSDEQLYEAAGEFTVFGRVTPEQKKLLVQALKARDHTVAMTGDGVNDVLAMKQAHCGIAMASGAQAASQVAKLVLLDSNFSALPGIVAEGRRVINNIQRAAALFLVKNIFSFFLSVITVFTNLPYPFVPLHLTLISAFTIGVPSFFLAMEPNYQHVTGKFLPGALKRAFPAGLTNTLCVLTAMLLLRQFSLSAGEVSTVCTALLAVVGLLALARISAPMGPWRRLVWLSMAGILVLCFTVIPGFLELGLYSAEAFRLLAVLAAGAVGLFFVLQGLFSVKKRKSDRQKVSTHKEVN